MKKLLPLLPVLFLISFGLSQSRVNRGKLSFNGKSEVITKLTGWSYNEKWGEWIDYENVILNEKKYKDEWKNLFMGKFYNSDQHFISIGFNTIYFKGLKYYILMREKYFFNHILLKHQLIVTGYIFTVNEYEKLNNFKNKIELTPSHKVSSYFMEPYNETKFLDLIQNKLIEKENEVDKKKFLFKKTKSDGTDVVRFLFPNRTVKILDFEKNYFEISLKKFQKLLDIK
tara:strand:- start:167 stop:850 length:684 start_codon:yes stop_codon:yes gene_type:complete